MNLPNYVPLKFNVDKVIAVADAAGCNTNELRGGYRSTPVLEYAEEHSTATHPYLMWQVCSGFAHGRLWADLGMNEMEIQPTSDEGVSQIRLTTDYKRLLLTTLPAFHLMTDVVRLYTERAGAS